jgi:hypothetical protein
MKSSTSSHHVPHVPPPLPYPRARYPQNLIFHESENNYNEKFHAWAFFLRNGIAEECEGWEDWYDHPDFIPFYDDPEFTGFGDDKSELPGFQSAKDIFNTFGQSENIIGDIPYDLSDTEKEIEDEYFNEDNLQYMHNSI